MDLWEKAVPLNQGRYQFGDQALVREYNALLDSKPGAFSALGALTNIMADMSNGDSKLAPERRTTPEERNRLSELDMAIDEHCIKKIQRRELIAIGFSIPRHPDDPPRLIPAEILARGRRVDFERDKISGAGLEFLAVRLLPSETLSKPNAEPNRAGRPSKRNLINKVYAECRSEGLIDYAKPQKAAIDVVRSRIQTRYPDDYGLGKGFGPEVIRDCIADDFGPRANAQKL